MLSDPTVLSIAKAHGVNAAQVALRWTVQQGVVAVSSSDKPSHLEGDLAIFGFELSDDEMAALSKVHAASGGGEVPPAPARA